MNFGGNRDAAEGAIAIDDFGLRDFRKIVILGSNPKDRNRFDPSLAHAFGELYRREGLINRVERAGEKPGLLSGDDGDAIGFPQLPNIRQRLFLGAPVAIHWLERTT